MGNDVDTMLSDAKAALVHADETSRLNRPAPVPIPEGLKADAPKHEHSDAPYSMAKEARDTGKGVKSAMDMAAKAREALK